MKTSLHRIASALLVCALVNAVALASVKSKNVTFARDVKVGGTLVKKGNYKVTFDDQTNELTISKNQKIIAKTTARLEERKSQSRYSPSYYVIEHEKESDATLLSVNIGGKYAVISRDKATDPAGTATAQ